MDKIHCMVMRCLCYGWWVYELIWCVIKEMTDMHASSVIPLPVWNALTYSHRVICNNQPVLWRKCIVAMSCYFSRVTFNMHPIESTKTTCMEYVSTGVLEKNKEYLRSKDKAKKLYDVSRHISLHMSKYKIMKIYYPVCQTYSPTGV